MRVLALEPFYAGSHRQFLDGWIAHSQHDWTVLGLPGRKWKWRMRHAPITFAKDVTVRFETGARWDAIFASDMLNLGEFLSLVPHELRTLPTTVYFHESQFTYPNRINDPRDHHFAFTNFVTALTADQVWFNSRFHLDEFLGAVVSFLKRMPDYHELDSIEQIRGKAAVHYPGVDRPTRFPTRMDGPLTILWSGRWEHDKNPEDFFAAIERLENRQVDFRLNVLGESFGTVPPVFSAAKKQFADKIRRWGHVDRDEYSRALLECDVIISTANHEYFGIGVVEAICSGVYPLLPRRLSYPELLEDHKKLHLYTGEANDLVEKLVALANRKQGKSVRLERQSSLVEAFSRFHWQLRAAEMDQGLVSRI